MGSPVSVPLRVDARKTKHGLYFDITAENGEYDICTLFGSGAEMIAEKMVRAFNSHDVLVDLAKMLLRKLEDPRMVVHWESPAHHRRETLIYKTILELAERGHK